MATDPNSGQPTFGTVAEVEPTTPPRVQGALLQPIGGKGLLVVNVSGLLEGTFKWPDVDLRIDGFCPDNLETNGKPAQHSNTSPEPAVLADYNAANFPLSLGSHELYVVDNPGPGRAWNWEECKTAPTQVVTAVKIPPRHRRSSSSTARARAR